MIEYLRKWQSADAILKDLLALDEAWDREVMLAYFEHQEAQRAT